MVEVATIARPYAEALFQATKHDLEGTSLWLNRLVAVVSDRDFSVFARHPLVSAQQIFDLVCSVLGTGDDSQIRHRFLRTLIDNRRIFFIDAIQLQFQSLKSAEENLHEAKVYSAVNLTPAELAGLLPILEKRFNRNLKLCAEVEPALIGGIRVVVGDEVLDLSVRNRLNQMKLDLTAA